MPTHNVPCPHWKECSGCPLIRYTYKDQLKRKFEKVAQAFRDHGFEDGWIKTRIEATRSSPVTLGYRNKAKWILNRDSKGILRMGIYRAGSHDVVDIPHCSVHAPAINAVSAFIKKQLVEHQVPVGSDKLSEPRLRYLIVRYSFRDKKLLCVFVTTTKSVPGMEQVVAAISAEYPELVVTMVQNINNDQGNVLLGEANRFLKKTGELTEQMGTLRVPVGPLSFLQVNSSQASYLYKRVREILGKGPYKGGLDLYSGVGLMALHLAPSTTRVLAVEEVGPAALEGITAARRNRIHNVLQLCADSREGLLTFHKEWGRPDWVVLNPPRKGCEEEVLELLTERMPTRLVYVSCNPQTLARDIQFMQSRIPGLDVESIEPVDMFPQTDHIETIVSMIVRKSPTEGVKAVPTGGGKGKQGKKGRKKPGKGKRRKDRSKTLH